MSRLSAAAHELLNLRLPDETVYHQDQGLLGHADLKSTQIYTHVSIGRLREIHAATHPAGLDAVSLLAAIEAEADDDDCHEVNDEESMT